MSEYCSWFVNYSESDKWDHRLVVGTFIFFAVFTPIVYYVWSKDKAAKDQPVWYFYPLSLIAFLGWGIGSSQELRDVLDISAGQSEAIVGLAAVGVPAVDTFLTKLFYSGEPADADDDQQEVQE